MKTIKLICATCNNEFIKDLKEYKRQIKNNKTRFFCNLSCSCSKRNEEKPNSGNIKNLRKKYNDIYSPFRWFVLRSEFRNKKKNYGCNMTVEYLKTLWDTQNGICPFTGWNLILPKNTSKAWECKNPANASLDRIDNSKGYIEGNVRFIAFIANVGKAEFTDIQLIEFCKSVTNNKIL